MYHIVFMFCEWLLCIAGVVDTTRARIRNDYPSMHGRKY
jgi:hypothetical protein